MKPKYLRAFYYSVFAITISANAVAAPVPLPDPGIPGYTFPEPKDNLMKWVNSGNASSINLHGWGLWTSLTAPSGQSEYGIANVPVYLTWLSPGEIAALTQPSPAAL